MSGVDFSDPEAIAFLAAALEAAGVAAIEIDQPGRKLRIVVENGVPGMSSQVETSQQSQRPQTRAVTASIAGIFTHDHPTFVALPVESPREVVAGDTLGFIRVGPILLPVKAPETGILMRSVTEDGLLVGYGDPLFEIEPRP